VANHVQDSIADLLPEVAPRAGMRGGAPLDFGQIGKKLEGNGPAGQTERAGSAVKPRN
jgi:hypothetical protein